MLWRFSPASSSALLRPSVYHPSIRLVVNKGYIRAFYDFLNVLFDPTCIVLKSGWNSTARMPRLLRRADPLFLPPPRLASYVLPFLVRPICLASSFLPCLTSSALSRFHPPCLLPHRSSSISPPSRRFGLSCKASSS